MAFLASLVRSRRVLVGVSAVGSVVAALLGACVSSNNPSPSTADEDGGGPGTSDDAGPTDAGPTNDSSEGSTPEASTTHDAGPPAVIATLAEGAISGPQHIAVAPNGDLYVASFAGSYSVVAPTGAVTGTFGNAAGSTHLVNAVGIALDAQGNVYVGDYGANAVLKFDSTGTYAATFNGSGSSLTFGRITGIAVDTAGSVYAADDDNGRIVVMNAQGSVTGQIATVPDGGSVEGTTGIAVSGTDVWAAEYYDRDVEEITTAGAVVASFGAGGTSATLGTFSQPYALALSGTTLYVADNGANTVQALSTSGVFAWILSGTVVDGGTVNPTGVAVSSDGTKLYVSDGAGGRIVVYAL
jgi:DNA-binding beta-propeller fold protein YncE